MGMGSVFDNMIEEKLLNLHTAFIAKVVSVQNENLCTIQPLDKIKAYGQKAKSPAVITRVPILSHVRHYSLIDQTLLARDDHGDDVNILPQSHSGHLVISPLKAGDIVLCVCAERDISSSVKGISTTPPVGHHQGKDAIVVGLIGG